MDNEKTQFVFFIFYLYLFLYEKAISGAADIKGTVATTAAGREDRGDHAAMGINSSKEVHITSVVNV